MSDEEQDIEPDELVTEFDFPLTTPVPYSHEGEQVKAQYVRLHAPTSRHVRPCAVLEQAFMRAIQDSVTDEIVSAADKGEEATTEKPAALKGSGVISAIAMSGSTDLATVLETARDLFTDKKEPVALLDGETRLTRFTADKISHIDLRNMVGQYMATFLLASVS